MRNIPIFLTLVTLKGLCRLFYLPKATWLDGKKPDFRDVRLFVLLNHTSLFEPLLLGAFPISLLWEMSKRMVYPVAEKTYKRPIAGKFFRLLAPGTVSLTRNRDQSWDRFLELSKGRKTMVAIAPEGRMKRPDGLDKHGKPMNLKTGVFDIIRTLDKGKMLVLYSGGLHHIQAPGSGFPKLFKKFSLRLEALDIADYKKQHMPASAPTATHCSNIIQDLQNRRDFHCASQKTLQDKVKTLPIQAAARERFLGDKPGIGTFSTTTNKVNQHS